MMNNTVKMDEMTIGFMGVAGSFSEKASKAFVEKQDRIKQHRVCFEPLVDAYHVRDALLERKIDMGVVAIKNSTTGRVAETEEAFRNMHLVILDAYGLAIHQCLFKKPGVSDTAISAVASHPPGPDADQRES